MKQTFLLFFLPFLLLSFSLNAQSADDIIGEWVTTDGKGHIKIERFGSHYFGKIIWLKEPLDEKGKAKTDINNPVSAKQNVPLMNLQLLRNFVWADDDKEWNDGTIYDPKNGKTYSCRIKLKDKNTLDVRGYIGISMIGRTDVWFRTK